MGINGLEKVRRNRVQAIFKYLYPDRVGVDDVDEMLEITVKALEKQLRAKAKNLQEGEHLAVSFTVDIIGPNGKMRGGSGAQRNMPEYIEWRKSVYERDNYVCQHCGSNERLNAHHIKSWAKYPALRFDVSNGLALCFDCHAKEHPHIKLLS